SKRSSSTPVYPVPPTIPTLMRVSAADAMAIPDLFGWWVSINYAPKWQNPRSGPAALPAGHKAPQRVSALAELLAATGPVRADLLTLDFAGIASDETCLLQSGLERLVVVDQCAGDAVTHCAGLAALAATVNVDVEIKRF